MAGKEGSNYFASMTDLLVGFLFIFVIMVAYFAYDTQLQSQQYTELDEYISDAIDARDSLVLDILGDLNNEGIQAKIGRSNNIITISGQSLFQSGSSNLYKKPGALERVDALSKILYERIKCHTFNSAYQITHLDIKHCNPKLMFIEVVFIEGHTDNVPVNRRLLDGSRTNLDLSARRAINTYQRLVETKGELKELQNPNGEQVLSVAAYGEQRPMVINIGRINRSKNRRIDILIDMHTPTNIDEYSQLLSKIKTI